MTNREQNTEMWSGDDVVLPFVIVDEENAPDPLSNFTAFTYAVRDKAGGTLLFPAKVYPGPSIILDDLPGGRLHVLIASADTATVAIVGGVQDFHQELEGVRTGGLHKTLCEGVYRLHKSIAGV